MNPPPRLRNAKIVSASTSCESETSLPEWSRYPNMSRGRRHGALLPYVFGAAPLEEYLPEGLKRPEHWPPPSGEGEEDPH